MKISGNEKKLVLLRNEDGSLTIPGEWLDVVGPGLFWIVERGLAVAEPMMQGTRASAVQYSTLSLATTIIKDASGNPV